MIWFRNAIWISNIQLHVECCFPSAAALGSTSKKDYKEPQYLETALGQESAHLNVEPQKK